MEDNETAFSASTVHLDHITTALSCLTPFGTKEEVIVLVDSEGLSFIRELNHVIRIQLFLSRELFISYSYGKEAGVQTRICIKINHLLDSFGVANRNVNDIVECTLSYEGYGSPFALIFEDSMISERVEYSTYLVQGMDTEGLELDRDQVTFECIIKGDVLYAALKDVKETGCKECYLYVESSENGDQVFAIISRSQLGLSKIKLPSSRSILEKLEVYGSDFKTLKHGVPVIAIFDFNLFDKIIMSVKIASKVLFRMDAHGLLSVNILSQTEDVIITDATTMANRVKSFNANKQLPLPKDYPGIVIEICLLEKEQFDEDSRREVEIFMEGNEVGGRKKLLESSTYSENQTAKSGTNLLALTGSPAEASHRDNEIPNQKQAFPANDRQMFF